MKKFFITLVVSWVLLAIIAVVAVRIYLDPQLKALIEQKGSEAIRGQITLKSAETHLLPFKVVLQDLTILQEVPKVSKFQAQIQTVEISINVLKLLQKTALVQVKVIAPQISFEDLVVVDPKAKPSHMTEEVGPPILEQLQQQPYLLALNFAVQDGSINYKNATQSASLKDFSFLISMPSMQSEWVVKTGADVEYGAYKLPVFLIGN